PFGPFLGIAGWLTILYGDMIQSYYLTWVLS
ncbi:MAG TPA: prepilin peptidase, partial [Glaciecola sp.]|nr:prepilin peptidase [Glaciecola sp.]